MKNNIDIVDKLIENEKKQKLVTTITAILFSLFAIIIISLGISLHKQNKTIASNYDKISLLNDSLKKQTAMLDASRKELKIANSLLEQNTTTLRRTASDYEKRNKDVEIALSNIVKQAPKPINNHNSNENGVGSAPGSMTMNNKSETKEIYKILKKNNPDKITIYIQYKDGLFEQSSQLKKLFTAENYIVPKEQFMKKLNFASSVRYFYETDKALAEKIAQQSEKEVGIKFKTQFIKLNSPKNQLEIWVGR